MRIVVEATDAELAAKADVLLAQVADLCDEAADRIGPADDEADLTKAARLSIKPHPRVALTQLRRRWVTGYRDQMDQMVEEVGQYLNGLDLQPPAP